jgi:2-haloacid dehalogenase
VSAPNAVIFDLGGVVLSWDPHGPYAQVMPAEDIAEFLTAIDFHEWNRLNDGGRSFEVAERELRERFPQYAEHIGAYRAHFIHALTGMVSGTSAVIAELGVEDVALSALTNWSAETFPHAEERFGILKRFSTIVVSGTEGLVKPDPAIFRLACERSGLDPARTVFVDDSSANVAAAEAFGLTGIVFTDAAALRRRLVELGLLRFRTPVDRHIIHLTERRAWEQAVAEGSYPWSARGLGYEEEGFVHCSFLEQLPEVRSRYFGDCAAEDLVALELDPGRTDQVVVEDLGSGPYPHLFEPLAVDAVMPRSYNIPGRDG